MEGIHHMNMDHTGHNGHAGHSNHDMGHQVQHDDGHMMHSGHNMLINVINGSSMLSQDAHDVHGGGNEHSQHMSMSMTFHGGIMEVILFSWWNVTEVGQFVASFFAIFFMALLYEGLKYYRKHLLWKTYSGLQYCAVSPPDKGVANMCATDEPQVIQSIPRVLERNVPRMMSGAHAWQTVLHGVQVFVSYMLMLVFMTYNSWLCAAVVLGSAAGYFLFGWRESVVVDFTEHCH